MPAPSHLRVERPSDGVALLTLDNPDMRNAMSDEMTSSWASAVAELAADRELRAVVVTGEGSAFCSGGNTSWIAGEPDATVDQLRTRMLPFYRTWLSIRTLEVPTIAAVNGPAIGAGLCLALACDLRYAATGARLGVPFVKLGMHAGMGGTHLLPEVVGEAHARDLLLTGRVVDADEARSMGLVSQVVPHERLLPTALDLATSIASNPPLAVQRLKRGLREALDPDWDSLGSWVSASLAELFTTSDHQEGVTAFLERREPRFEGR
jgi:enoyl-CoA hydratase/carnithine racemase